VRRFDAQITAQDHAEQSAPGDEPVAVAVELKPLRAVALAGGECFGQRRQITTHFVQRGAPDMNFVVGQSSCAGGNGQPASESPIRGNCGLFEVVPARGTAADLTRSAVVRSRSIDALISCCVRSRGGGRYAALSCACDSAIFFRKLSGRMSFQTVLI